MKNKYLKPGIVEIVLEEPMMLILSAPDLDGTEFGGEVDDENIDIEADAPAIRRGVWGDLWAEPVEV